MTSCRLLSINLLLVVVVCGCTSLPAVPDASPLSELPATTLEPPAAVTPDVTVVVDHAIKVLPVFFVPSDVRGPTEEQKTKLVRHLDLARDRYRQMLGGRDTFGISGSPIVYTASHTLPYFRRSDDQGAAKIVIELSDWLNTTSAALPSVLLVVVMNPQDRFPAGGGRPINGGHNEGAGIVVMSSFELDDKLAKGDGSFQSTLQHELGHAFGLVHVSDYGYDQDTSDSIMSYNPRHHWDGFTPPVRQGVLLPEDVKALAMNDRVFPLLSFDPATDVPKGYALHDIASYPPMPLDTTWSGYSLYFDGVKAGQEQEWTGRQAIENLLANKQRYPAKIVEGTYGDASIVVEGVGYELYYDGHRVGHEPSWTYEQAQDNLAWNTDNHPGTDVVGVYNGQLMPE